MSGGGMHGFLTKPIKQDVLLQTIAEQSVVAPTLSNEEGSETDMTLVRAHQLAKLTPTYLLNCRRNIIVMRDALDRADFETVRSSGHQMSGTGTMYGFRYTSDTGGAIEQAAESSNIDVSRDWVGKLSSYLDGIDPIYRATGNPVFAAGPVIPRAS